MQLLNARLSRTIPAAVVTVITLAACERGDPTEGRGAGMPDATLPPAEQVSSYGAALRTAFDLGPGLSLLLDPGMLPRGLGHEAQDSVPGSLQEAMRAAGLIQGSCAPKEGERPTQAPICEAEIPGYVVRVSEIYRLGRDSLQLHLLIRRYDTPATAPHQAFDFEEAYQLAKLDGEWKVVRKARLARAER